VSATIAATSLSPEWTPTTIDQHKGVLLVFSAVDRPPDAIHRDRKKAVNSSNPLLLTDSLDVMDTFSFNDFLDTEPSDLVCPVCAIHAKQDEQPFEGRGVLKQRLELLSGIRWNVVGFSII